MCSITTIICLHVSSLMRPLKAPCTCKNISTFLGFINPFLSIFNSLADMEDLVCNLFDICAIISDVILKLSVIN